MFRLCVFFCVFSFASWTAFLFVGLPANILHVNPAQNHGERWHSHKSRFGDVPPRENDMWLELYLWELSKLSISWFRRLCLGWGLSCFACRVTLQRLWGTLWFRCLAVCGALWCRIFCGFSDTGRFDCIDLIKLLFRVVPIWGNAMDFCMVGWCGEENEEMDEDKDHDAEVKEQVYGISFVASVLGLVACVTTCKQTISFTPLGMESDFHYSQLTIGETEKPWPVKSDFLMGPTSFGF